ASCAHPAGGELLEQEDQFRPFFEGRSASDRQATKPDPTNSKAQHALRPADRSMTEVEIPGSHHSGPSPRVLVASRKRSANHPVIVQLRRRRLEVAESRCHSSPEPIYP